MKNKAFKLVLTIVIAGVLVFGASFGALLVKAQTSGQTSGQSSNHTYTEALITYYQTLIKTLTEQLNALLAQRGSSALVLKNKFDEIYSSERNNLIEVSKTGNARDFYYFTQPLNGLLSMFEATNDTYYLKEAVDLEMNMINAAKDYNHDGILGWPDAPNDTNTDPSYGGEGCYLYYLVVGPELSRTVYLINQYNINDFQDKAQLIQNFIEKNILSRPWKTGYTFNLRGRQLETLLNLYLVTKNPNYYDEIVSLATKLIATTYPNPNDNKAVLWSSKLCKSIRQECYDINGNCPSTWEYPYCFPSDIGHGSNYVEYVVNAYNNKILYSKDYLDKLIYTFKKYIWNQSLNYVEFAEFIDGAKEPENGKYLGKGYMGASVNGGWFKLGQYDPEIQLILKNYMNNGKNNPIPLMTADHLIRIGRWNLNWLQLSRYGDLTLNEKILSVSTTTTTTTTTTTSTTKPLACTDSDGGRSEYVKGTVTYQGQTYTDTCITSSILKEYICDNNSIEQEYLSTCKNGYTCQDGACVPSATSLQVQILKPATGDVLTANAPYEIKWNLINPTSSDVQNGDRIRIFFDQSANFTNWTTVVSDLPLTQTSYLWNTPNIICYYCSLRLGVYRPSTGYWVKYLQIPVYLKQIATACTDSDGGKNPYVKGTVTYNGQTHTDFCPMIIPSGIPSTTEVYEFYCENGIMKEGPITCPTGTSCQNGACVPNQTSLMDALNKLSASLISLIELLKR